VWTNLPRIEQPVTLTLAGVRAQAWQPPAYGDPWTPATNAPLTLSMAVWNHRARSFDMLCTDAAFDDVERLCAGTITPAHLHDGALRLRVSTGQALQPGVRELWLEGIYLHPFARAAAVNVNTASPAALRAARDARMASLAARVQAAGVCTSVAALARRAGADAVLEPCGVQSSVFDVCVEGELVRRTASGDTLVARRTQRVRLTRDPARVGSGAPLQRRPL
jgi:hypothetical protein